MIKTITATDANRRFSELLRLIAAGDTVIVTSHGRPIIRMERVSDNMLEHEESVTLMQNPDGRDMPRWPSTDATPEERQRSHHEFMDYLRTLPIRNIGPWTRDELYDDDLGIVE